MKEDFINQTLDKLEKELHIKSNNDFIGDLFEERAEEFHMAIIKNSDYKKLANDISKINDKIMAKYENAWEIINEIEEYVGATYKMQDLIEKQMYKFGIYDGMKLILEGIKRN